MFGYIRPASGELKVKEYNFYRAVYCGLCRSLKSNAGCIAPFTLSYDFVFLALVRGALVGDDITVCERRCAVHPFGKRPCAGFGQLDLTAAMSAVTIESKLEDDRADGDLGIKALAFPFARHMRKTAEKRAHLNDDLRSTVSDACRRLREREKAEVPPTPDEAAEFSGEMTAALFEYGLDGTAARIAHEIGRHIGRWIYLIDAADDYERDMKKGSFNPFRGEEDDMWKQRLKTALLLELDAASRAVELIDFTDRSVEAIVKNTIYLGMPETAERILSGNKTKKENKLPNI